MLKIKNNISVFEHESLRIDQGDKQLSKEQLIALQKFYGEKGIPYYNLIHNGVRFNHHVGVIQVGKLVIEILPKADRYSSTKNWRNILIGMLRAVGAFNIQAPSSASLSIKNNFILDLYFELFVKELEYLIHKGLIKQYRNVEGNKLKLKGNLLFSKHIQHNLVQQQRFYVKHSNYDKNHVINQILYKTILLLKRINSNTALNSRIGNILLNFPEMNDLKVTSATFNKITLNRKNESYKNALEISRLILLNYHPDISKGQNHVLALMFDMNLLWEKFIYVSLRKHLKSGMTINPQTSKYFWRSMKGNNSTMKPDIIIEDKENTFVLDTKWKNIGFKNPSPDDLRQLYVYHEYYIAEKVALIYPGIENINKGRFYNNDDTISKKECSVIQIPTDLAINDWQLSIADKIYNDWLQISESSIKTKQS